MPNVPFIVLQTVYLVKIGRIASEEIVIQLVKSKRCIYNEFFVLFFDIDHTKKTLVICFSEDVADCVATNLLAVMAKHVGRNVNFYKI